MSAPSPSRPQLPPPSALNPPSRPPDSGLPDSAFEPSGFGSRKSRGLFGWLGWIGWRRRLLVLAALLGCLGVFSQARWLAATPQLDGSWEPSAAGQLVLTANSPPALAAHRGDTVVQISISGRPPLPVDALLLHRAPRWQVDDGARARQVMQHERLAALLIAAPGAVQLHFDDGSSVAVPVFLRGYAGLGVFFWPLAGVSLLLFLSAVVVLLAKPQLHNLLFVAIAFCQAANLLVIATETVHGLGMPAGAPLGDMGVRVALDLVTAAAIVHAFTLHPRRLWCGRWIAAAAWTLVLLWLVLAHGWNPHGLWWWAQGACLALGLVALALVQQSLRLEPNPYALVMRRFVLVGLGTLLLATGAVAIAARMPDVAPGVAAGASGAWYLFLASLLLLTPFLARSRQVLREFAMLAGLSTVATSLDLLFVAVFSLGSFTSLAIAVFIAVGLYAGARQWILNRFIGSSLLTTERTFDQIYRAARAVQAKPAQYLHCLTTLLRELFDPLELQRVDRVPAGARVIGGGAALVVPLRSAADDGPMAGGHHGGNSGGNSSGSSSGNSSGHPSGAPGAALLLRFAHRGKRLFTLDDARLADRVVDQLRRAVAYDQAVEHGRSEERLRLAQDLHDDIGARLLTLMYQAPTREMEDYIRHTLQDLKTLTRGLAASEHRLSHAAAEWKADLTQRMTVAHAVLGWAFSCDRDLKLSVGQWSALTRVLRELVTNALYHGHASRIDVNLTVEGRALMLQVADDGGGRDPQGWAHGLGLGGVRKRVKLLGGEVAWHENGSRGIVCTVQVHQFAPAT